MDNVCFDNLGFVIKKNWNLYTNIRLLLVMENGFNYLLINLLLYKIWNKQKLYEKYHQIIWTFISKTETYQESKKIGKLLAKARLQN